jgi:hypothetical protein
MNGHRSDTGVWSTGRPTQVSATENMQMEVEHGLAGIWSRVGHDTVTALGQSLLCCDLGTRDHELSQEIGVLIVTILDCRHMLFWDDQCVDRGLGIDIIEGHRAIVLMDNLGRDGFLNNSAK